MGVVKGGRVGMPGIFGGVGAGIVKTGGDGAELDGTTPGSNSHGLNISWRNILCQLLHDAFYT